MHGFFKRALDIAAAFLLALLLAPLLLAVAALIAVKLGLPVFFRQKRIGLHGKPFDLIKFRTMTQTRDANGQLLPDADRLTPFGAMLRATSIDELPELWNVFIGEMSLVGPRPLLPDYLPHYTAREQRRHAMRPGITGLAQVSGRNGLSWDARLSLDADYVEHFSIWRDFEILGRTVLVVLQRNGINAHGQVTMHRLDEERRERHG